MTANDAMLAPVEAQRDWFIDEAVHVWHLSQARARRAFRNWQRNPGAEAYTAYRAAQDQADRAQDALSSGRSAQRPARTT